MSRVHRVLVMLLGAVALAIGSGWLAGVHPFFESVTNVRAQLVPVAFVPLAGLVALRRWRFAVAALIVFLVTAAPMVPYWTASADPVATDRETLRVMQFNVFFDNTEDQRVADHIAEADAHVVVLHEPTPTQWDRLGPLLPGYPHHIAAPLSEADGQLGGGMIMLSRTPLTRLPVADRYSPTDRVLIAATTEMGGESVTVVGLHPFASRSDERKSTLRETQLQGVAELAAQTSGPMLVLADLNVAPTSPQYHDFVEDLGWRNPHVVVGWKSTWPTWGGPFGMPIDHVFVSNHFDLHSYEIGDGAGSDHLSVIAEISLRD